jgi:hypothetical protein
MPRNTKSTSVVVSSAPTVANVQADAAALFARIVSENPDAARAIALQSVIRPGRVARSRAVTTEMSEADRAVAAANMSAGFRQTLFRALIAKGPGTYTTSELSADTGIALYRVRGDLQTIANRLADVEKFPGIGYRLAFIEGKRGLEQSVMFTSLAPKPKKAKAAKGRALVPHVAPVAIEEDAGSSE